MAARGRPKGVKLSETHRDKIRKSNVLNALIKHAEGQRDMSASQVTAGLGLLRKALPDLSSVDINADVNHSADAALVNQLAEMMGVSPAGSNEANG